MWTNDLRYSQGTTKARTVWQSMLDRCYNEDYLSRRPTYRKCTVCEEWHLFSNFKEWFDSNYIEGYHLDKDILVLGNTIYSPATCVFIPNRINNLINLKDYTLPIYKHGNRYRYHLKKEGKLVKESFSTEKEAIEAYCIAKEDTVKSEALKSYSNGEISIEVFNALNNWTVMEAKKAYERR